MEKNFLSSYEAEGLNVDGDTLIDEYDEYLAECESALEMALTRINIVKRSIIRLSSRNPFDRVETRLKTFESTIRKCRERGYAQNIESIKAHIFDIAGIRIVTKYKDEIEIVRNLIEHTPGINIVRCKDYVNAPKPNGYKSLHLGCQVEIYTPSGSKLVPVEIQIRSKSMNLWASIEHEIGYRNDEPDPRVKEFFKKIGNILSEFDEITMEFRDYSATTDLVADLNTETMLNGLSNFPKPS